MSLLARCDACGKDSTASAMHVWWSQPLASVDYEPFGGLLKRQTARHEASDANGRPRDPVTGPFDMCGDCAQKIHQSLTKAAR